jgi:hypothetical protein
LPSSPHFLQKLKQKNLYLEAIKNLIIKYEKKYNDDSHDRLLEKLKQTTIDSFSTVEHFFKIEFGENKPFSFSGRLLTQAKKQGGKFLGGRFNQSLTCRNFFSEGELLNILSNAS